MDNFVIYSKRNVFFFFLLLTVTNHYGPWDRKNTVTDCDIKNRGVVRSIIILKSMVVDKIKEKEFCNVEKWKFWTNFIINLNENGFFFWSFGDILQKKFFTIRHTNLSSSKTGFYGGFEPFTNGYYFSKCAKITTWPPREIRSSCGSDY